MEIRGKNKSSISHYFTFMFSSLHTIYNQRSLGDIRLDVKSRILGDVKDRAGKLGHTVIWNTLSPSLKSDLSK